MRSPSVAHVQTHRELSVGMLSTFPPQRCGLATFAEALSKALELRGNQVLRVALNGGCIRPPHADAQLVNSRMGAAVEAADLLSECDVVIVQHEYGIFGGEDGDEVLTVLEALTVPSIVVLHTVPIAPTNHQRQILEEVCRRASCIVVMAAAAGERLLDFYEVDGTSVFVVPHGATPPTRPAGPQLTGTDQTIRLLTWGLLGPGKGIEHTISAIALVKKECSQVRYTVAGATHPNVLARDGQKYRHELEHLSRRLGIADRVTFDETYRDVPTLMNFVASASAVVLPYDSRDQVTSGVLVDALAAGRPVIATAFPHAVELLSDGAGIIVPHGDIAALAAAIRSIVEDPDLLVSMAECATSLSSSLSWTSVAEQYNLLCDDLVRIDVRSAS